MILINSTRPSFAQHVAFWAALVCSVAFCAALLVAWVLAFLGVEDRTLSAVIAFVYVIGFFGGMLSAMALSLFKFVDRRRARRRGP